MSIFPRARKIRRSSIIRFAKAVIGLARRAIPAFSSKFSKRTHTQHQHVAILCLKVRLKQTYEGTVDLLSGMPGVREVLGLERVPDPSTLCKAFERLKAAIRRILLQLTLGSYELCGIAGIDSSGEERSHSSKYYTRRAKLHIEELKVTILVDVRDNAILDVHLTTTRKHDSRIGPKIVRRSARLLKALLGDKGFDDEKLRNLCRNLGIRPLIEHREFRPIQRAWNARMSKELYNQRNQCESVRSSISRKYGPYVRSKRWYKQFREFLVKCFVYNLDRLIQLR